MEGLRFRFQLGSFHHCGAKGPAWESRNWTRHVPQPQAPSERHPSGGGGPGLALGPGQCPLQEGGQGRDGWGVKFSSDCQGLGLQALRAVCTLLSFRGGLSLSGSLEPPRSPAAVPRRGQSNLSPDSLIFFLFYLCVWSPFSGAQGSEISRFRGPSLAEKPHGLRREDSCFGGCFIWVQLTCGAPPAASPEPPSTCYVPQTWTLHLAP